MMEWEIYASQTIPLVPSLSPFLLRRGLIKESPVIIVFIMGALSSWE
jgi:hypothetical protein